MLGALTLDGVLRESAPEEFGKTFFKRLALRTGLLWYAQYALGLWVGH